MKYKINEINSDFLKDDDDRFDFDSMIDSEGR